MKILNDLHIVKFQTIVTLSSHAQKHCIPFPKMVRTKINVNHMQNVSLNE